MERELRQELYLAFVLLGADDLLAGAVRAWRDGAPGSEALADLRNWNEAKLSEIKEWLPTMSGAELESMRQRVGQYEQARGELKRAA